MSEKSLKTENKSIHYIFNYSDVRFCLVCKESVTEDLHLDHDITLSNHINSKNHKKNVRTLFKLCVPMWSGAYAGLVHNLVFDVTFERNESSFIKTTGDNFVCLVCQENIAQGTDPNVTKSIINHIQSDFHLVSLKDDISWVYSLDGKFTCITFHKSDVYCSICKQIVQNITTCPLQRAADHLKIFHKKVYKILVKQLQNNSLPVGGERLCQLLKPLTIVDNSVVQLSSTLPSSSSFHRDFDSKFSLDTCGNKADKFEDNLGSDEKSGDRGESSDNPGSVCPECGELIEIFNENDDFSRDLHMQKHKPLWSINNESNFEYQDNADHVCPVCKETIQVFNKDLKFSIDRHFEEKVHDNTSFTLVGAGDKNRFDFLSIVFDSLPVNVRNQQILFAMDGNEVFCKLCYCKVPSSKCVEDAGQVFIEHMSSTFHVDQFKASSQFMAMPVLNCNKINCPQEPTKDQDDIFTNLCKQNPVIDSNKQFIEKRLTNYHCTICDKKMYYSKKNSTLVFNLVSHLKGEPHKKSLKKLHKCNNIIDHSSNSQTSVSNKTRTKIANTFVNHTFMNEKDEKFFCEICQKLFLTNEHLRPHAPFIKHNGEGFRCIICNVSIPGSTNTCENLPTHLYSIEHREKFVEVISKQDYRPVGLDEGKTVPVQSTTCNDKSLNKTQRNENPTAHFSSSHQFGSATMEMNVTGVEVPQNATAMKDMSKHDPQHVAPVSIVDHPEYTNFDWDSLRLPAATNFPVPSTGVIQHMATKLKGRLPFMADRDRQEAMFVLSMVRDWPNMDEEARHHTFQRLNMYAIIAHVGWPTALAASDFYLPPGVDPR